MLLTGPDNSPNLPLALGGSAPPSNKIHGSVIPRESSSKTACRSVQPFLHSAPESVPLLYNGPLCFPQKLPFPLGGSGPPSNTWYLGPTRVINTNGISIGSAVFVWVPNATLYNALSMGKKTPNIALEIVSPRRRRTEPRPRALRTKNLVKIARAFREIRSQTRTQTHRHTLIAILQHRYGGRSNSSRVRVRDNRLVEYIQTRLRIIKDEYNDIVDYKNKNWLQFLFTVKAAVLKQQISKFYPQIQRTKASDHTYFSHRPFINVKAIFCA